MDGRPFLGPRKASERTYVYLHCDRMDGQYDMVRGVRDKRFKYFRNYHPERPNIQDITYRLQMPRVRELLELHQHGSLGPNWRPCRRRRIRPWLFLRPVPSAN
ncbi:MAG: hypothetical protein J5I94_03730 [Phaeodactylibacter sp.]|nr:hypothetical protein [Phaeodactylibacter sp.]